MFLIVCEPRRPQDAKKPCIPRLFLFTFCFYPNGNRTAGATKIQQWGEEEMTLLKCRQIVRSFGDRQVLNGVNIEINSGDRIGLVGLNGSGKSTLARIITGDLTPDQGAVTVYKKNLKIGYLQQDASYTAGPRQQNCSPEPEENGVFLATAGRIGLKKIPAGEEGMAETVLSSGERAKLAFSRVWASRPDLLILDEPTNHLDFQGAEQLVAELQKFNGAVLIISHDRWFLDQTVTKIYELTGGVAALYPGNYSYYREEKKRRFASQLHRYRNERKEEEMIRAEINRLREWSAKAHRESTKRSDIRMGAKEYYRVKAKKLDRQVKSKIKRLERLKETATPKPQAEPKLEFAFTATNRGRRIIDADGLSKAFGEKVLFQESRFFIQRGEKFGLIGPNGCGKTTLLRLFLGEERPDTGSLWISPTLNPGYLRQDLDDLDPSKSALEIMNLTAKEKLTAARTLLAHMGIDAGMATQPTGCLSLGERVRIKLVQLLLDEKDLLLLDEPTNHLDLPGRERLEEALSSYTGTIILVSHDRYLLETVCNKLLVFGRAHAGAPVTVRRLEDGFAGYARREEEQAGGPTEPAPEEAEEMVIENRIAFILGQLNRLTPGDPEYLRLDEEFQKLVKKKRELSRNRPQ